MRPLMGRVRRAERSAGHRTEPRDPRPPLAVTVYLELADYLLIAEAILGLPAEFIADFNRIRLADSALAAPRAGFGGVEAYPDFATKAAVLCWHLVKNHPLPEATSAALSSPRSSSWSATAEPGSRHPAFRRRQIS